MWWQVKLILVWPVHLLYIPQSEAQNLHLSLMVPKHSVFSQVHRDTTEGNSHQQQGPSVAHILFVFPPPYIPNFLSTSCHEANTFSIQSSDQCSILCHRKGSADCVTELLYFLLSSKDLFVHRRGTSFLFVLPKNVVFLCVPAKDDKLRD